MGQFDITAALKCRVWCSIVLEDLLCSIWDVQLDRVASQATYMWRNIEAPSCNNCCEKKYKYYIFWVCVCSLRYPARSAHALPSVACPAVQYFCPHYLINGKIFRGEKKASNRICVLTFCTNLSEKISHSKKNRARYYHKCIYIGIHVKYPSLLSDCNETSIFSTDFRQKYANAKFHEISRITRVTLKGWNISDIW
jgi:hypothetical protein